MFTQWIEECKSLYKEFGLGVVDPRCQNELCADLFQAHIWMCQMDHWCLTVGRANLEATTCSKISTEMCLNKIPTRQKCSCTQNLLTFVISQKAVGDTWSAAVEVPQWVLKILLWILKSIGIDGKDIGDADVFGPTHLWVLNDGTRGVV